MAEITAECESAEAADKGESHDTVASKAQEKRTEAAGERVFIESRLSGGAE